MEPIDFIIMGVIALIVGGATAYIIKAKKSGKKCIGCPDGGSCKSCSGSCASCTASCASSQACQCHCEGTGENSESCSSGDERGGK